MYYCSRSDNGKAFGDGSIFKNTHITSSLYITFEPGSAVKPLIMASALDHGIVTPESHINCENGYWEIMNLRDSYKLGICSATKVLYSSSNIGIAKIAEKMGKKKVYDTLLSFGFGDESPLVGRSKSLGFVRKIKNWDFLFLSRFSIGQGLL